MPDDGVPRLPPPPPPFPPSAAGAPPLPPPPGAWAPQGPVAPRFIPPPAGAPGFVPPARSNGLATAALVLGLVSIVLFFTFVVPVLALVFGLLGAARAKQHLGGHGLGRARAGWILGVLGLVGFVAIVAASLAGVFDDGDTVRLGDAEVGQCFDLPESDAADPQPLGRLDLVDCDEPHDGELIHIGEMNPDRARDFPGIDELIQEASRSCLVPFRAYVGIDYQRSVLQLFPVVPNELSWKVDGGQFDCFVYSDAGLTASVRGTAR